MENKKKYGLVEITLLLLFTLIWVSGVGATGVKKLTLRDCIELALVHHPQIQAAEFQLQEVELDFEKLKLEDQRSIARQSWQERETAVLRARQALEETRMRLGLEIESAYYQLLKSIQTLKNKEESLQWTERQLEIVQVKYDSGMIPERDFHSMQERFENEQKALADLQYDFETTRMEFNLKMGLALEQPFELQEKEFPFEPVEITLEETLAIALQHADSMEQARTAVIQAREVLERKRLTGGSQVELLKAEHALILAETALKEAEKQMVITVRSAHMGLRSGHDRVIEAEKQCTEIAEDLEIVRIKYEAGMLPLNEMIAAHKRLQEAEIQAIQVIYDFNLAKASFYRTIGKGYSPYAQDETQGSDQL